METLLLWPCPGDGVILWPCPGDGGPYCGLAIVMGSQLWPCPGDGGPLNTLYPKILRSKFNWNWLGGLWEIVENVKFTDQWRTNFDRISTHISWKKHHSKVFVTVKGTLVLGGKTCRKRKPHFVKPLILIFDPVNRLPPLVMWLTDLWYLTGFLLIVTAISHKVVI